MKPMSILSLFFFLFLHHCFLSNTQNFPSNISICGNLTIQHPFQLQSQNTQQDPNYSFFSLRCTDQGNTLINIPLSGDFLVQEISYSTKEIELQNPSNCLPRKLLHLNLFSSPFSASSSSQNYTFSLLSHLHGDLRLSWDVHLDKYGHSNRTSRETSNSNVPRTGRTARKEIILIFFVGMSLILPSLLCLICVSCRVFLELSHRRRVAAASASAAATARLAPMIVTEGLDESTIQSYPKVVLGESRRISGINVMICAICLGEYSAGETLRCIPECEHCFHAECVDKWLKMNSTCPVCRNSLHS